MLYPALRIKLGNDVAEHCLAEHQELKERLQELTNSSIRDPNFDGKLQEFMEVSGERGAERPCRLVLNLGCKILASGSRVVLQAPSGLKPSALQCLIGSLCEHCSTALDVVCVRVWRSLLSDSIVIVLHTNLACSALCFMHAPRACSASRPPEVK